MVLSSHSVTDLLYSKSESTSIEPIRHSASYHSVEDISSFVGRRLRPTEIKQTGTSTGRSLQLTRIKEEFKTEGSYPLQVKSWKSREYC